MKYVLLIMILLVGCSVIEGDKPTFAKGAATALVEAHISQNFSEYLDYAEKNLYLPTFMGGRNRETGDLTSKQIENRGSLIACEAVYAYIDSRPNRSRGDIFVSVTPTAEEASKMRREFGSGGVKEYLRIPYYLEPIVIEGLFEEYVGEGVWRVELKGNFLELYEMYDDPSEFEPYVWEVYEPLGNIRRISKEFKEYC